MPSPLAPRFVELQALLGGARSVVVAGHERADGDAVGAVGSLRRHLELEGKQVMALLCEPLSPRYAFMEFARRHEVWSPERHGDLLAAADVFVMCDLNSLARLGPLREPLEAGRARTVCFDHHPCDDGGPADLNLLDSTATATGRIVWDYIRHAKGRIDHEIAECVFVSIASDTGWFRYQNTDAEVIRLAAELSEFRLDLPAIHRSIYQSNGLPLVRLLGHVVRSMNVECDGRFAWALIHHEFLADLGVDRFESDPILDVMRSGDGVSVVALFTQNADRSVSLSLRSRGRPDVNRLARLVGGGGHAFAAGATLEASRAEQQVHEIVSAVRQALRPGRARETA